MVTTVIPVTTNFLARVAKYLEDYSDLSNSEAGEEPYLLESDTKAIKNALDKIKDKGSYGGPLGYNETEDKPKENEHPDESRNGTSTSIVGLPSSQLILIKTCLAATNALVKHKIKDLKFEDIPYEDMEMLSRIGSLEKSGIFKDCAANLGFMERLLAEVSFEDKPKDKENISTTKEKPTIKDSFYANIHTVKECIKNLGELHTLLTVAQRSGSVTITSSSNLVARKHTIDMYAKRLQNDLYHSLTKE